MPEGVFGHGATATCRIHRSYECVRTGFRSPILDPCRFAPRERVTELRGWFQSVGSKWSGGDEHLCAVSGFPRVDSGVSWF